ncbi:MAG: SWIM zinc finger family protein, partial [Bacteroidia bacterium]
MESIIFLVQGSETEPYQVNFTNTSGKINISCTCQAAINGLSCKHRLRILAGDKKDVVSANTNDIPTVINWL